MIVKDTAVEKLKTHGGWTSVFSEQFIVPDSNNFSRGRKNASHRWARLQ